MTGLITSRVKIVPIRVIFKVRDKNIQLLNFEDVYCTRFLAQSLGTRLRTLIQRIAALRITINHESSRSPTTISLFDPLFNLFPLWLLVNSQTQWMYYVHKFIVGETYDVLSSQHRTRPNWWIVKFRYWWHSKYLMMIWIWSWGNCHCNHSKMKYTILYSLISIYPTEKVSLYSNLSWCEIHKIWYPQLTRFLPSSQMVTYINVFQQSLIFKSAN